MPSSSSASMPSAYNPADVERRVYDTWLDNGYFTPVIKPGQRPFTVTMPPPNVTGVLHMGHVLNNTIQDIFIRKARMQQHNTLWLPGTDHASIATEAKVTNMLKSKGIDKREIGREKFFEHAMDWKEKYGGTILKQLKRLGAS